MSRHSWPARCLPRSQLGVYTGGACDEAWDSYDDKWRAGALRTIAVAGEACRQWVDDCVLKHDLVVEKANDEVPT
jgi:hypothetical protein